MVDKLTSNTLRGKLLKAFVISLSFTLTGFIFSIISSYKVQEIGYRRFTDEEFFILIEERLSNIEKPLLSYLSFFSTSSLSDIMENLDILERLIPPINSRPIYNSRSELIKREIYFLIDQYITAVDEIINLKRGRKVSEYSLALEELNQLYDFIVERIDELSLSGYRVQIEEYKSFLQLFSNQQLFNLILVLLVLLITFSVLMSNLSSITNPLYVMSKMARKISEGNFLADDISIDSVEEITNVSSALNKMKNSIRHYIQELNHQKELEQDIMVQRIRNMKMEQLIKRMELYTLQAQMNPHFLFNTINTGVQLAIVEEADRTAHFMENLADVLRYNIREKRFFVPLREEYQGVLSYINILKIRFPRSISVKCHVDNSILDDYQCPAMILQPLIENSIVHGLKDNDEWGEIIITIEFKRECLWISVRDNGKGIESDVVDQLLIPHTHDYAINSKVMGLENVIQRCFFFYPDIKDVIQIVSSPGNGTEIVIKIDPEVEPCIEL